jgi:hypothetical protein
MLEGATFLEIEPSEILATRFSTLWYTNDMLKQWQSNIVFHTYYQQLKVSIEEFPHMTPHTLHQYRMITKFHTDSHFIYIIVHKYERKEELQSYYKITDEDMEQITKEWLEEFLAPVVDEELFENDTIRSHMVTWVEHVGWSSGKKRKKKK